MGEKLHTIIYIFVASTHLAVIFFSRAGYLLRLDFKQSFKISTNLKTSENEL